MRMTKRITVLMIAFLMIFNISIDNENIHFKIGNEVFAELPWELVGMDEKITSGYWDSKEYPNNFNKGADWLHLNGQYFDYVKTDYAYNTTFTPLTKFNVTASNYRLKIVVSSINDCFGVRWQYNQAGNYVSNQTTLSASELIIENPHNLIRLDIYGQESYSSGFVKIYRQKLNQDPSMTPTAPTQNGTLQRKS